ncbi:putative ATP-dependent endonuclease of the OLD family [Zhouia amylolytica]|uniref:Putative ATP-dependent endonuclease of the OLD family n=1 Tax=Zhouia amylolytica TaxID=376730 RepID=A0A1I6T659_9FLAO|nr:AAA family ATPase [Zhouia amylolytica]SFS84643.1 putative ATP-dependent endonuclease of the OLD family [Zhouia amylolytica]
MHLSTLKLWNFRKYGRPDFDLETPHLVVPFKNGLNVLIGENDSGKTAILDAIKLVLKTHAYEWIKVEKEDFFEGESKLRIELFFKGLSSEEAKNFIEWLGWEGEGEKASPVLRLIYEVEIRDNRIIPTDIKAGMDDVGYPLNAEARSYLKTTYLKALRDADTELIAKKNSRVSQILQGHSLFKEDVGNPHPFTNWFSGVNEQIKDWFEDDNHEDGQQSNKAQIKDVIDKFLQDFISEAIGSKLNLTNPDIKSILEKVSIGIEGSKNLGLGTMNRLFMATELLHLKRDWNGLKLCLIEELEAHLHPQAQMKVVESIQRETENVQFILTTHSPNLASKVPIENLIICKEDKVFSLDKGMTKLDEKNLKYLKRFLDVTKSNLFFSKGVIIVEGWAEEIIIPELAKKLGYDLTKYEVSIVNVGSTAYLPFAKIFLRADDTIMNIPVAIVTDLDVRPKSDGTFDDVEQANKEARIRANLGDIANTKLILNIAKEWTLEWCLFKSDSVSELFKQAVSRVHSRTKSFKYSEDDGWHLGFEQTLITKLSKAKGNLDKVAVANEFAELISSNDFVLDKNDEYISYLIDAIRHTCRIEHED